MDILSRNELILALHNSPGVGATGVRSVLRHLTLHQEEPRALLQRSSEDLASVLGIAVAQAECIRKALIDGTAVARALHRSLQLAGVTICAFEDAAYPAWLSRWLTEPPPVLYARGDLKLLDRPLIAVANSNGAPSVASDLTERAVSVAIEQGFAPVTGHNRPEYQLPALVACRKRAPCCYVLDRGILPLVRKHGDAPPFKAARIWWGSTSEDLLLSAFPPALPGLPGSNRQRDRLVLALATCIASAYVRPGGRMESALREEAALGKPLLWLAETESCVESLRPYAKPAPDSHMLQTHLRAAVTESHRQ